MSASMLVRVLAAVVGVLGLLALAGDAQERGVGPAAAPPPPAAAPQAVAPAPGWGGPVATTELPPDVFRPDEPPRLDKGPLEEVAGLPRDLLGDPYFLGFAGGLYRPPPGEKLDPLLAIRIAGGPRAGEREDVTYGYVMFQGRITPEKMARVAALGVELLEFHPNNCRAARIPVAKAVALSELPEVRWVGFARPGQKVHPVLARGILEGWIGEGGADPQGAIPFYVNLFESDLNERSRKISGALPVEATPGQEPRPGNPEFAAWTWETDGRAQEAIERLGARVGTYHETIRAYEAMADPRTIGEIASLDFVSFVEWRPPAAPAHDRVVPDIGQDYLREVTRANTVTVGVTDSGFHLGNGGFNGHVDLIKQAVGWDLWPGGCGSPFCDEPGQGYHGTSMLGTVCGRGTILNALRGTSPYLGEGGANHRLFLVKCLCIGSFQYMRQPYTDPWGNTTPRPALVSNSWGVPGCVNNCTQAAFWVGSEAGPRAADAEVFNQNQLYLFAAGNEGGMNNGTSVPGTIGDPAVAKNVLTIGMTRSGARLDGTGEAGSLVTWGSAGPCGDNRWKPNVAAPGCTTWSTLGGTTNQYSGGCGTSSSTAAVAGVLAGVAERYQDFRDSAPLARAWAMATAVPWQDQSSTTPGGWLAWSHLNTLGMGRVSSLKAHDEPPGLPWVRSWASGTVTNETDTFDVYVPPSTTRLVIVLTWDDPAASAGANPARVSDIDLYVDKQPFTPGGNTGEYSSTSGIQTVEHVILDNPENAVYRIKVYPYNNPTTVRWGVMAVLLFGDTTPSGTFTSTVDRAYIRPGETVNITLNAFTPSYLATNVYFHQVDAAGFTLNGTETTLKDGQVLTNRHTPEGNYTPGDILKNDSRSMRCTFTETSGAESVRTIRHQARSDNMAWLDASSSVIVDGTAPPQPIGLWSSTHTVGGWSNNRTMSFQWSQPPDNLSGVDGYAEGWREGLPVGVPATRMFGWTTSRTIAVSQDYSNLYYGLRTVDRSGNWNSETAAGPYGIDTVRPGLATSLGSPTHPRGDWSRNPDITFTWTAAVDDRSGLDGYAVSVSSGGPADPGTTRNLGAVTSYRTTLASSASPYYFNIRAVDRAGNWSSGYANIGPYRIDTVAPQGPTNLRSSTHTVNVWSRLGEVQMAWTAALDAHSGLDGYVALFDQSPTTVPSGPLNVPAGATSFLQGLSGGAWYFHIVARDVAGNSGAVLHSGPYLIDLVAPTGVALAINGGAPETTSLDVTLTIAGSDPLSGLDAMRFRNDAGVYSPWEPFATSRGWNLTLYGGSGATGTRGVAVEVRDRAGNVAPAVDTIYYYIAVRTFGSACAGSQGEPAFVVAGVPGIGRTVTFTVSNTAAPVGVLYLGFSNTVWNTLPLPLELGRYGVPGCYANVSLEAQLWYGPPIPVPIGIPAEPVLAGVVTYWQWVLLGDPSGRLAVTTRGAEVRISGP